MRAQVENMKEQVHLLTLKNNQMQNDIKRQKTVNQARQDEIMQVDLECKKKDDEAINLKRALDKLNFEIREKRLLRDRQDMDN
jgi:hypothetical protein